MLTEDDIKTFQALYKKRFGREINREQAYEQGIKLIHLMKILTAPNSSPSVAPQK